MKLVPLWGVLALAAVPLAGCGGEGDDRGKVEESLRHYLVSLPPDSNSFPIGAGTPRVEDNRCFKLEKDSLGPNFRPLPPRLALWNCVIKFGTLATPVIVTVRDGNEVVFAMPGGVLKEVKPTAKPAEHKQGLPAAGVLDESAVAAGR